MKKLLLSVIIMLIVIVPTINAASVSFDETIAKGSYVTLATNFTGKSYKYGLVKINSITSGGKYKIAFVSYHNNIKEIGKSIELSSTGNKHILPKSGMSCPGGYCFGVGSSGQTTITSENDCTNGYCSYYGIRIYNTSSKQITIKGTYELFTS